MNLPEGTVTFFLTDIEGSTRHWDTAPEAMRGALLRHDLLAAAVIERHEGTLVKHRGEGDSLFVVFARADRAIEAAVALQLAFADEPWNTSEPIRVRIALHTGEADLRDGDYYGPAVNRCARLRSLCRGGQILLSEATQSLTIRSLPPGAALHDLGQRRLRDLQTPERVFVVAYPGLLTIHTLDSIPNNLPRQLTSFIGREEGIEEVKRLLHSSFLLTLTGSGGVGKTRLAQQVASETLTSYPDGVWMIDLSALSDPSLVPQAVALSLKVREEAGRPLTPTLIDHLQQKRSLLILDNCEHLLSACAQLAEDLLRACPGLHILATSREPLNIGGETLYRVPSLTLPEQRRLPPLDQLAQYESVRLFIDRATAASPGFRLSDSNSAAISDLCNQLDGIPLAIELAAVRVKSLSVEQIAGLLSDRFRLLTGGSRTAVPRQQTLRALIDWSYDLLNASERELFHRLSVFVGGFTLEAAETVCSDLGSSPSYPLPSSLSRSTRDYSLSDHSLSAPGLSPMPLSFSFFPSEVLDLLTSLIDKSLVIANEKAVRVRYRLQETLRQYAREKLATSGKEEEMQHNHLAYYLTMAQEAERKLRGSEQAWWLEQLDTEHDNLRAALNWQSTSEEDAHNGLKLAASLWWFWHVRGHFTEGREWLAAQLSRIETRNSDRAKALNGAAVLASNQGDYSTARALSLESLDIKRELGDRQGIASSLNNLATLALAQSDYSAAQPFYEESLAIERRLGNRQGVTSSLIGLANIALEQGNYVEARCLFEEGMTIKRELGDKRGVAAILTGLGRVALNEGQYVAARAPLEEGLDIIRLLGDRRAIGTSLQFLGTLALAEGDWIEAAELLSESLELRREMGDKLGIANVLHGQGLLAAQLRDLDHARTLFAEALEIYHAGSNRRGIAQSLSACAALCIHRSQPELAAKLIGASDAIRKAIGCRLHAYELSDFEEIVNRTREALGEVAFMATRAVGRSLSIDQAVSLALSS